MYNSSWSPTCDCGAAPISFIGLIFGTKILSSDFISSIVPHFQTELLTNSDAVENTGEYRRMKNRNSNRIRNLFCCFLMVSMISIRFATQSGAASYSTQEFDKLTSVCRTREISPCRVSFFASIRMARPVSHSPRFIRSAITSRNNSTNLSFSSDV